MKNKLWLSLVLSISTLVSTPTLAATLGFDDNDLETFSEYYEQYQSYMEDWESWQQEWSYWEGQFERLSEGFEDTEDFLVWADGSLDQAENSQTLKDADINLEPGELGLHDFGQFREDVKKAVSEEDPTAAGAAANRFERWVTREKVNASIGKEGQEETKEKLEQSQQKVENVEEQGQKAQESQVTQEVMKSIALQNSEIAGLTASTQARLDDVNTNLNLANANLANISEGVDSSNLYIQSQGEGTAMSTLQISMMAGMYVSGGDQSEESEEDGG